MKLALFDIDGVLADDRHRVHHALKKEWADYFEASKMSADKVWPQGAAALNFVEEEGWAIGYMTGRREDTRRVTSDWLSENHFPASHQFYMRPVDQRMRLAELKTEWVRQIIDSGKYEDVVLYDDDPEVIELIQKTFGDTHGVHCTWHKKEKALIKKAAI